MEQDNINILIQNAINSNRKNKISEEKTLIENFYNSIKTNLSLLEATNKIDLSNNNAFKIDNKVIDTIFNKYSDEKLLINTNNENNLLNGNIITTKTYNKLGIILVIFDGNFYVMLELIILGILTHNTIIFSSNGYMHGSNNFIINLIQTVLQKENYIKEMFQHSYSINSSLFFNNFKTINKTIVIGDNDIQNKYLKLSTTNIMISGYTNYEIYIEDDSHLDLIKQIVSQHLNIFVYIRSDLNISLDNSIYVNDIDEAISQINNNGSLYSSSIFTKDKSNASNFIRNINSKNVMVNMSPTIEQGIDLKQEDLLFQKTIILPDIYKF